MSEALSFPDRVAQRAVQVNVVKVLLSILAFPFWLIGALVGIVFLAVAWLWAACVIGFADARSLSNRGRAG